jgi:hypothetical protein
MHKKIVAIVHTSASPIFTMLYAHLTENALLGALKDAAGPVFICN